MLLPGGNRAAFANVGRAFFEGAGQAYRDVISLIVVANCFATGVKGIGIGSAIDALVRAEPNLLLAIVPAATFAFAWICGSGIAATQGLFPLFVGPAIEHEFDPSLVGAITCVAAAAGRTASPVAAVTLMASSLVGVRPGELIRRVFGPILIGQVVASVVAGIWFAK
jgi:DcuC family C4-dicarboxylate transporter